MASDGLSDHDPRGQGLDEEGRDEEGVAQRRSGDLSAWRLAAETPLLPSAAPAVRDSRVPCLTIVCHPHLERLGERVLLRGLAGGETARLSRLEPLFATDSKTSVPRPLGDPYVSRDPIRLGLADDGGLWLRRGRSQTLLQVGGVAVEGGVHISPGKLREGVSLGLAGRILLWLHEASALPAEEEAGALLGKSDAMALLRREIARVADVVAVPVLLRGESGTGKELAAAAIHRLSPRRNGPFLALNMAAVPASLAASELFGAAKGAYTGASRSQAGFFRQAEGGTLFLDEIGETPAEVQPLLLRVLESKEIQAVGEQGPRKVDVRIIAATDARLEAEVSAGRFRAPLLHRLSGYEISLPPLRERLEDLGLLLGTFLARELEAIGQRHRLRPPALEDPPWLPATLVERLLAYPWPGNVRQLANVARQLVIGGRNEAVAVAGESLEGLLAAGAELQAAEPVPKGEIREAGAYRKPAEVSEAELLATLRRQRWRVSAAAEELGLSRASLYGLMESCPSIRKASELGEDELRACASRHRGDLGSMADELEVSVTGLKRRMTALGLR